MRAALLAIVLFSSSCAGSCAAIGGGAIGGGVIGGSTSTVVAVEPPGTPFLFFDASDIDGDGTNNSAYTSGDPVAAWVSSGSATATASQATSTARPTYRSTLGPGGTTETIQWDAGDVLTTGTLTAQAQPITTAAVAYTTDLATTAAVHGQPSSYMRLYASSTEELLIASTSAQFTGSTMTHSTWQQVVARFNGASSWVRIDGAQSADKNPGTGGVQADVFHIGSLADPVASGWNGRLSEVLVYADAQDPAGIESYFDTKWGM